MNLGRNLLRALYDWLAPANTAIHADLIFVLAGRQSRKTYGLQLFRQTLAPRILLSVGRFEIRRFANLDLPAPIDLLQLASAIPPPQRHFFVHLERNETHVEQVPPGRFGTLTEVEALAKWVRQQPEVASVLVISSAAHLRRVRICCRALLPGHVRAWLVPVPENPGFRRERWWQDSETRNAVLSELVKLPAYKMILWLRKTKRHRASEPA